MNVTRNVISDLWPLYQSGEMSEDSRQLIHEFLRSDPEFARLLYASADSVIKAEVLPPLRRERELELLQRTKRFVWLRDALFWVALFLSVAPLTAWDTSWGNGWLIRDLPWLAGGLGAVALVAWVLYFALKRRLSATGW